MNVRAFFSAEEYAHERGALWTAMITFLILGIAEVFLYSGFLRWVPGAETRVLFLPYLVVAISLNVAGVWYVKSVKGKVTCMTGCMGGMTLGMTAGYGLGMVVGATNGMLIGSAYGLFAGMVAGGLVGRKCGTMGVMQGLMAGFMGGVMGAMTSLMLLSENVFFFLTILLSASTLLLAGLVALYRKEREEAFSPDITPFIAIALLVLLASTWLMVFGPRSALVTVGWVV